jgi:putative oxidoreductase
MKDALILAARTVFGGYMAAHGAQKLFGTFDGPGLDKAGAGFEYLGMKPGKHMAALAGASELTGGALIATGTAHPLGPIAIGATMAVATLVHQPSGPFSQQGGYELPATNLGFAGLLAAVGTGRYALGLKLPPKLAAAALVGAAGLAGVAMTQIVQQRRQQAAAATAEADAPVAAAG